MITMVTRIEEAELLDRIKEVFRRHGYAGASLSLISEATGLGRASLYHRFPGGKAEMADRVFDEVDTWLRETGLASLATDLPPRQRLESMVKRLLELYNSGRSSCLLDVLSLGNLDPDLRKRLRGAMSYWISSLAATFRDAGLSPAKSRQAATDMVARVQGGLVMARVMDDAAVFRKIARDLP